MGGLEGRIHAWRVQPPSPSQPPVEVTELHRFFPLTSVFFLVLDLTLSYNVQNLYWQGHKVASKLSQLRYLVSLNVFTLLFI